jgi:starvation-inducible DNA-binding protein
MAKAATATAVRTFKTSAAVSEEHRQPLIALLNLRLADSIDIYSQIKWAHWNVKGKDFYQLHLLFDSIAEHIEDHSDTIAERIAAIGGVANGTIRQAAAKSSINEADLTASDGPGVVKFLVHNFGYYANALRTAIDEAEKLSDPLTVDLFTQLGREADKDLWFLEAHIQS